MDGADHAVGPAGEEREQPMLFLESVGILGLRAAHAGPRAPDAREGRAEAT